MVELSVRGTRALSERAIPRRALADGRAVVAATSFLSVGGLAFANGGYFPVAWGWAASALLLVAVFGLVVRNELRVGALAGAFLAATVALTAWVFLSLLWTASRTETALEGQRMLVYLGAALAGVVLVRRTTGPALLTGTWAAVAVACTYSLATRLFPEQLGTFDPIATYRLSNPVGYWNGLGVFAATGSLLALGLAARSGPIVRCLAAASSVPMLLVLYFTFSRGGWGALFVGLAVAVAADRRRLQLIATGLVVAPWPAIAILVASRSSALTRQTAALDAAARDGHGLAAVAIGLAVVAALAALALDFAESVLHLPRALRRVFAGTLAFAVAAGAIAIFGRYGLPPTLARKAYHAFNAPLNAQGAEPSDLNNRLFSFSGNGRSEHWHTAWQEWEAHPVLGGGAGTYAAQWAQHRRVAFDVQDAHSLYVETLAELGPVGLGLLVALLGIPLVALVRGRASPLAAAAGGAYVGYLAHAGVDWDWELPAVTLVALFAGLSLVAAARREEEARPVAPRTRYLALAAALAVTGCALVGLLGASALSASSRATASGNWAKAEREARRASDFEPWSAEPWRKLAEAQAGAGDLAAARVSFRKALAKEPGDWTLWYELATVSRGAEERRALDRAARLNPLGAEIAGLRRGSR